MNPTLVADVAFVVSMIVLCQCFQGSAVTWGKLKVALVASSIVWAIWYSVFSVVNAMNKSKGGQ